MGFLDYIRGKLIGKSSHEATAKDIENYYALKATEFNLTELALFTAIDLIAKTIAKCEFVTVKNNEEVRMSEYYRWNYAPNIHQTKSEFIAQFVAQLIFYGEAVIFETSNNQLLVAESFVKNEKALYEDTFTSVFARNWSFKKTFLASEVIYLKYSNAPVKNLLKNMCNGLVELMNSAGAKYNNSAGRKGILYIEDLARNDVDFEENFSKLMSERFNNYFKNKNAVLPLFEGYKYEELPQNNNKASNNEINDIQKLRKEIFSNVGNTLHIPPAIIEGTASQLGDAVDAFIANSIDPIVDMLQQAITKSIYGEKGFLNGDYLAIDTTYAKHIDAISQATNLDKAIACRLITPSKAQKYCNMVPSNDDTANQYYMTKNYQTAEMAVKGGENNG